jgi:hypothetical protein
VRLVTVAAVAALAPGCAAHSPTTPKRVPDVTGERLDVAENRLDDVGLRYDTIGGGDFGILVRSHWVVCDQEPEPGTRDTRVELYVERDCDDW